VPSLSVITVQGHLGRDAEVKTTPSGKTVTEFTMAVTVKEKDATGQLQPFPNWYLVSYWQTLPEFLTRALVKGAFVTVIGRFQARVWKTQEGAERTSLDIRADYITTSTDKSRDESAQRGQQAAPYDTPVNDEDVPF